LRFFNRLAAAFKPRRRQNDFWLNVRDSILRAPVNFKTAPIACCCAGSAFVNGT
jgi:hypothetical protein